MFGSAATATAAIYWYLTREKPFLDNPWNDLNAEVVMEAQQGETPERMQDEGSIAEVSKQKEDTEKMNRMSEDVENLKKGNADQKAILDKLTTGQTETVGGGAAVAGREEGGGPPRLSTEEQDKSKSIAGKHYNYPSDDRSLIIHGLHHQPNEVLERLVGNMFMETNIKMTDNDVFSCRRVGRMPSSRR